MHTVTTTPDFAVITEEEVLAALARYNAQCESANAIADIEEKEEAFFDDPIVQEVARLVEAYTRRFEAACREHAQIPEEALLYQPASPVEQAAFQIFTEALHDSLQEADDEN